MKIKDPISTTDAAHILGVSTSTVRKWVDNDKIEYVRIGKNNFVSRRKVRRMKKAKDARAQESGK